MKKTKKRKKRNDSRMLLDVCGCDALNNRQCVAISATNQQEYSAKKIAIEKKKKKNYTSNNQTFYVMYV